jgi:hypothetical protein
MKLSSHRQRSRNRATPATSFVALRSTGPEALGGQSMRVRITFGAVIVESRAQGDRAALEWLGYSAPPEPFAHCCLGGRVASQLRRAGPPLSKMAAGHSAAGL